MCEMQKCKICGRELPISDFKVTAIGRLKTCKECVRQRQIEGRNKRKAEIQHTNDIDKARQLRISDFTSRELMTELKRRGYEGKLHFVEVHEIDLSNI